MINDAGGINGRKIKLISLDDAYSPPKTFEQTRKLVEQDDVLLIFDTLGTATNAAIQKYLNTKKVPQLFPTTGATRFADPKNFPWTMNFEENEQQKLLRGTAVSFVRRHCPSASVRAWDRTGELPEEVYAAMAEAGLLAMMVPAAYGGIGSPIADCAIVLEEIARPSVDFATRLALIGWGSMILGDFASEEIKSEILPRVVRGEIKLSFSLTEPGSGSDAASLQTRARRDGDDYVISGQKLYSSGAHAGAAGGLFGIVEGVRQLRGGLGPRQVEGAELAIVHNEGGILSSHCTLILGNQPN